MNQKKSPDQRDWIQDAVIRRAEQLDLTSYAIAQMAGGAVSADHVRAYLTRQKSMGSHKLQHVLRALGLEVVSRALNPIKSANLFYFLLKQNR